MSDTKGRAWLACAALMGVLCGGCSDDGATAPDQSGPLADRLPVDERLLIEGLLAPVNAVRDENGRTHIYASSMEDALRAQGYLIARDRATQLDFFRRYATGRLAEALSDLDGSALTTDISFRHIGLARVAAQQWEQMEDPSLRARLEAYAAGVSQAFAEIRNGERSLPDGVVLYDPSLFEEWTPIDSLAVARLQTFLLSYDADGDIANQRLFDSFRAAFDPADSDPAVAARADILRDVVRFQPPDLATTIDGFGAIGAKSGKLPSQSGATAASPSQLQQRLEQRRRDPRYMQLMRSAEPYVDAVQSARYAFTADGDFGSNNWAVAPERSQTGRAMLASDPHLSLSSPPVFWPVALHVGDDPDQPTDEQLHVSGLAFAGIPAVILGHNRHIAWGATVTGYDVSDVWTETLTEDGQAVIHEGQEVALEKVEEVITLQDGSTVTYEVLIVPHHGPIVPTISGGQVVPPDPSQGALSIRWTGMEPTEEFVAVFDLLAARSVDEAREALKQFGTGGQNWMLADDNGDIAWTSHVNVPIREDAALSWDADTYQGLLPCLVMPGDGETDWTGYWADDAVPWAKNPTAGYLATANQDAVGGTLDNDPSNDSHPDGHSGYLGCAFAHGFREGRIQQRIEEHGGPLSLEDMASIQGDWRSPLGSRLVPSLLMAIESAQNEASSPGSHPDLTAVVSSPAFGAADMDAVKAMLETWRDESDYVAHSGVSPDDNQALPLDDPEARAAQAATLFNVWLPHFMARVFGDESDHAGVGIGGTAIRALVHLVESDPQTLATYDATLGDSILFDDMTTTEVESRHERMIRALLDALSWLDDRVGAMDGWRWGHLHTLRLQPVIPVWAQLAIPSLTDDTFPAGFPRPGDMYVVDASNFSLSLRDGGDIRHSYGSGPTQRFVIELDPVDGFEVRNALPGGATWDQDSPHFADQMERWRRNETHRVPFVVGDVLGAAESHTLLAPM